MTARRTLALFVSTLLIGPCVSAENPPGMQEQAKAAVSTIQGKLKVRGLQKPVNVLRDRWGVAHIYAQNQHGTLETLRRRPPGRDFGRSRAFARSKCATAALSWRHRCRIPELRA